MASGLVSNLAEDTKQSETWNNIDLFNKNDAIVDSQCVVVLSRTIVGGRPSFRLAYLNFEQSESRVGS
jgi:hypothetical protein